MFITYGLIKLTTARAKKNLEAHELLVVCQLNEYYNVNDRAQMVVADPSGGKKETTTIVVSGKPSSWSVKRIRSGTLYMSLCICYMHIHLRFCLDLNTNR